MIKVFIDGREGTTGLRIEQRLSVRSDIELLTIDPSLRKDSATRARLLNQADVAFLCLPDAASIEAVSLIDNPNTIVIDASTAHRTLHGWAYGLPELSPEHRKNIMHGKRIAVPGCHASGFLALAYPLILSGLLPKNYPIACHSVTGYTGGGKSMISEYESSDRDISLDSPRQYGLSQEHKHLREMVTVSGLTLTPIFMPIVADFPQGMVVTLPLHKALLNGNPDIMAILTAHYQHQPMIKVLDHSASFLPANALAGRDDMEIAVHGHQERIVLTARFDNLGKGASGAAIQCMNIALGLPEQESLIG